MIVALVFAILSFFLVLHNHLVLGCICWVIAFLSMMFGQILADKLDGKR